MTGPMRQWHVHRTLALVYRDAYNNQLNDRYQGKWAEYEQLAKASAQTYFQIGVGLVADPVPKAALRCFRAWPGPRLAGMFYVAVTWVNAVGPRRRAERFRSVGNLRRATACGDGEARAAEHDELERVCRERRRAMLSLQNQSSSGNKQQLDDDLGLNAGAPLPAGQQPTWFVVDHRVIERG